MGLDKLTRRNVNWLGMLACAGMMGYALFSQHVLGLEPCPLCVFQRVAVIALGIVFGLAALHNPGRTGALVYAALGDLAALGGAVVAGRHVWLQNLPPEDVPACGPGLNYLIESFPLSEALAQVFQGSGECADVDWSFLGLSMPAWVLICCVFLGIVIVVNNLRRD